MTLARKIFSNTAWQIFGKAVTAILGIVSIKLITNYLSRSVYGEYTTIYDYTALFAIIADFGLFIIAIREMAHDPRKEMVEKIAGNVLSIRTVLAIVFLGLGALVAVFIPSYQNSHIPYGISIVSLATVIILVATTMSAVLQFYLRMAWASVGLIIGKLITVAYIVVTILYIFPNDPDRGFPHLLYAWIAGGLATLLITRLASSKCIRIAYRFDFAFWKSVFVKALPYGLALVLGTIYFRMGTLMLSLFGLKDQVGYYGVPLRFLEILQIIPHYFMNSVLPTLTMRLKSAPSSANHVVKFCINALSALAFPILIGGFLLSWPITAAVSSPDFLSHKALDGSIVYGSDLGLKILLVAMTFTYLHITFSYALVAMGRQIEILWANGLVVVVNVVLNYFLAPRLGFIGSSLSAVAAEVTMFIVLFIRIRSHIKDIFDFSFIGKTILSSLIMGVVLYFSADFFNGLLFSRSLFVLVPVGMAAYAVSMVLTKAVTKEMTALFKKTEPSISETDVI